MINNQYCLVYLVNRSPFSETVYFENIDSKTIGYLRLKPNDGIMFKKTDHYILRRTFRIRYSFNALAIPQDANPGHDQPAPIMIRTEEIASRPTDPVMLAYSTQHTFTLKKMLPIGSMGKLVIRKMSIENLVSPGFTKPFAHYLSLESAIKPIY